MSVMILNQTRSDAHHQFLGGNVKKQLRDTQRMLARPNLPSDVRREQERKLAALQVALTERVKAEQEKKMTSAYRMVRFFERKKAERHLKQAEGEEAKTEAVMDLLYVLNFPKDRKYISLFPTTETADERVLEERRALRLQIAQEAMAKANVQSVLEAPLPQSSGSKAAAELSTTEGLKLKQALAPGHKDSDEDDDEEESDDDDDDQEEDSSSENGSESDDDDNEDEEDGDSDDLDDSDDGQNSDDLSDDSDDDDDLSDDDDEDDDDDSDNEDMSDEDSDDFSDEDDNSEDDDDSDDDEEEDSEDDESDDDSEAPSSKRRK